MIRIVIRDATGTEKEADMGETTKATEAVPETVSDKPKRARHRVATKTTVTKTVEKELTFTEADLRRMLRIPEGAELGINDRRSDGAGIEIVATWTVKK